MKETTFNMAKYADSEEIHEKCAGCAKVFDWHGDEGTIVVQKCLTYIRPAIWWKERSVATAPVLVKDKANPKGILKDLPVVDIHCPVATHLKDRTAAEIAKINPLKAAKRAQRGG